MTAVLKTVSATYLAERVRLALTQGRSDAELLDGRRFAAHRWDVAEAALVELVVRAEQSGQGGMNG